MVPRRWRAAAFGHGSGARRRSVFPNFAPGHPERGGECNEVALSIRCKATREQPLR